MRFLWFGLALLFLPIGCGRGEAISVDGKPVIRPLSESEIAAIGVPYEQASDDAKRVLVVINQASGDSQEVGQFYVKGRKIPHDNVVFVTSGTDENITPTSFKSQIEIPIRNKIASMKSKPDFIVLTKGIPIRVTDSVSLSTDSALAAMDIGRPPIGRLDVEEIKRSANPYFNKTEPFSSAKYGFYLVTRLDGYTVDDAKKLVTNSLAAKSVKGPFLIDEAPERGGAGYGQMQSMMKQAATQLRARGFEVEHDTSETFVSGSKPCIGYVGWGTNDAHYRSEAEEAIRFLPGAIAETFVSTSARTFKHTTVGQSLITNLIVHGVTGIKGYVDEPYTFALAHPDILFDRYTRGYTLAESFYMSSLVLKWKDIVVGDPICRPFPKQ